MTDEEHVLYFNEHRLAKLESYLMMDGSSSNTTSEFARPFLEQTVSRA
jgi:hypothetical protein